MLKKIVIIIILTFPIIKCSQNLTYTNEDTFEIANHTKSQLTLSLTMAIDQYINSGSVNVTVQIHQKPYNLSLNPFNILFFNLQQEDGRICYLNYSYGLTIPQSYNCNSIDVSYPCTNHTGCINQSITYQYKLERLKYLENLLIIQNKNDENIKLRVDQQIYVFASNAWFYWTIGLACVLLINLVFLTGVVLYWSLKYKKTKRKFQQFKLTQGNNQQLKNQNHYE